jgi:DNA polymerase (family 10)
MLLYRADDLRDAIEEFLLVKCPVKAVQVVGACRRRVEVIEEIAFVIETDDFPAVVKRMQRYGGRTALLESSANGAMFALAAGIILRLHPCSARAWALCLIAETGSEAHLKKLEAVTGRLTSLSGKTDLKTETAFYREFGLAYIEPELREGNDEVERAGTGSLPELVTEADIRGDLHAHSTSSDGAHSIEQMATAARERGYEYIGISDHSQSLKIARGVSVEDLWQQIRYIDKLNAKDYGIRILKSSEVDILADGSLDYPDELLKELDYTVCSIHSRFGLNPEQQTERLMRAMDNRYFNILGHATGRLLLKRPGYEIDIDRVIDHARRNGCFFEINSSPDRLDLSADNARRAAADGVLIAVNTDSHSMGELQLVRRGLDQARRAGLAKSAVLNCRSWQKLHALFKR